LQIRSYQDLKYHLFLAVAVDENKFRFNRHYFLLNSEQITNEVRLLGGLCHLTKEAAVNNGAVEHRLTLDPGNFERWLDKYKIADNEKDLKKVIQNL
jgi:hypothetical protein